MRHFLIFIVIVSVSIACPHNFYLDGTRCYFIADFKKTYSSGSEYCRDSESYLPSIANFDDQIHLMQIRNSLGGQGFFLGLECNFITAKWEWTDGRFFDPNIANFDVTSDIDQCTRIDKQYKFMLNENGKWKKTWDLDTKRVVCTTDYKQNDSRSDDSGGNGSKSIDDFCCWWLLYLVLPIVSSILGFMCLCFCCIAMRRRAREQHSQMMEYAQKTIQLESEVQNYAEWANERKEYLTKFNEMKKDEWEIDRRFVNVDWTDELGNGAFGKVYRGTLPSENLPPRSMESGTQVSELKKNEEKVAVKMLHESADRSTVLAFLDEIELMKDLGYHERLVNLLGCVTASEPCMLIVELCSKGDLLRYMKLDAARGDMFVYATIDLFGPAMGVKYAKDEGAKKEGMVKFDVAGKKYLKNIEKHVKASKSGFQGSCQNQCSIFPPFFGNNCNSCLNQCYSPCSNNGCISSCNNQCGGSCGSNTIIIATPINNCYNNCNNNCMNSCNSPFCGNICSNSCQNSCNNFIPCLSSSCSCPINYSSCGNGCCRR